MGHMWLNYMYGICICIDQNKQLEIGTFYLIQIKFLLKDEMNMMSDTKPI